MEIELNKLVAYHQGPCRRADWQEDLWLKYLNRRDKKKMTFLVSDEQADIREKRRLYIIAVIRIYIALKFLSTFLKYLDFR